VAAVVTILTDDIKGNRGVIIWAEEALEARNRGSRRDTGAVMDAKEGKEDLGGLNNTSPPRRGKI
jgi:hypothetical protein